MGARPLLAAGFAAALCLLQAATAQATVVVIPTLEAMTDGSDVVVHARVVDQVVSYEGDRLVTLTTLEVIDGVKGGKPGELLEVFQVGGVRDGVSAWITGAHRFRLHDEVVLFAVRKTPGASAGPIVTYGIGVGVFEVVRDADGARAVERIGDVVVAQKDGRFTAPQPRAPVALDAFLAAVRRMATQPRMKAGVLREIKRPEVRR